MYFVKINLQNSVEKSLFMSRLKVKVYSTGGPEKLAKDALLAGLLASLHSLLKILIKPMI